MSRSVNYTLIKNEFDDYDTDSQQDHSNLKSRITAVNARRSNAVQAFLNILCGLEGTFGLPYAIRRGGYAAIVAILLLPILTYYTGRILIDCLYEGDKVFARRVRVRTKYADIGSACWPRCGGALVTIFQVSFALMFASSLLVLSGSFLAETLPMIPLDQRLWTIAASIVLLPTVFLKHLSSVSWVSLISNVALVAFIGVVLKVCVDKSATWTLSSIPAWDTEGVFFSISMATFGYTCHFILPSVEDSMASQYKFNKILGFSLTSNALLKTAFAVCSFLTFKDATEEAVINNIAPGTMRYLICGLMATEVMCSYAIPLFVVAKMFDKLLLTKSTNTKANQIILCVLIRVSLVAITLAGALLIPDFSVTMAIPGSLCGTVITYIFPCWFHLKLKGAELSWRSILLHILILSFAMICGSLGVFFALKDLVKLYR